MLFVLCYFVFLFNVVVVCLLRSLVMVAVVAYCRLLFCGLLIVVVRFLLFVGGVC